MNNSNGVMASRIISPHQEISGLSRFIKNLLVLVNFFALFILANRIYVNLDERMTGNTATLLSQAGLAMGVLTISWLLYTLVNHRGKQFAAVYLTYLVAGIVILLRVFGKVFSNIWSTNMTLAVYIILGVILVSLGMFIYMHNKNN